MRHKTNIHPQQDNPQQTEVGQEERLLSAVRHGDRKAMRDLYNVYSGRAMAVVRRYVPDNDAAGDVLQDSFVKVLTSIGTFSYRGEGSLGGWIMRIVANEALNHLRRNARLEFTDDVPDVEDCEPDVEMVPQGELTRMIDRLPSGYRTVLNLYVFEEKSHREIGALLGIGESSSASQYLRAKRLLARMIKDYLERQ